MYERVKDQARDTALYIGGITDLAMQTIRLTFRRPFPWSLTLEQFDLVAVRSLSIVIITSMFIGMVLALQTAYSLAEFGGNCSSAKWCRCRWCASSRRCSPR